MNALSKRPLAHALTGTLLLLLLGVFVLYVLYQARFLITGPVITLADNLETVQAERTVVLRGRAENITSISINNRPITTDQTGHFVEPIVLENGYTIVSIAAKDRYGRIDQTTRTFVYVPQLTL